MQGLHNLCVVYVERGELLAAETCLAKAHTIAPTQDYILRHLNIVRSRLAKYAQQEQLQNQQQIPEGHEPFQENTASTSEHPSSYKHSTDVTNDHNTNKISNNNINHSNSNHNKKNDNEPSRKTKARRDSKRKVKIDEKS